MATYKAVEDGQTLVSRKTDDGRFECLICPHACKLRNGQRGVCQARIADNGVVLEAYGKITHAAIEPIEKKPIYHYKPNLKTLSVGGYGCSMSCSYCQNWMVSQENKLDSSNSLSPSDVCSLASKKSCGAVCFTYNEPIVYFEFIMDLAQQCKEYDLDLILKTNAYANIDVWKRLCSVSAAMNIDWKGSKERYSSFGVPDPSFVVDCIVYAIDNTHVEVSVPVYYDSKTEEHREFAELMSSFPNINISICICF
jgi:pyruvate formate lyase activating enzyme